jgi:hypothetical protein
VETAEGCIDIMTLGVFLEFSDALSRPHYFGTISKHEVVEENVARWKFRQFLRWYRFNYAVTCNGYVMDIGYMANRFLIRYAVALVTYTNRFRDELNGKHLNSKSMRVAILNHFHSDWPELIEAFRQMEKESSAPSLVWDAPPFEVIRLRQETPALQDVDEFKAYVPGPPDDESDDDQVEHPRAAKRRRTEGSGKALESTCQFIFY